MSSEHEEIISLTKDGFSLHSHKKRELDIALISLRIGLEAYYSTYSQVKQNFRVIESKAKSNGLKNFQEEIQISNYAKTYVETIFHFQHFIEVSIEEILRQEHTLLASLTGREHVILYKLLLEPKAVTEDETEELFSIDFQDSTARLIELIQKQKINNHQNMGFIKDAKTFLSQIGKLRNRLVHRGTFVLRYTALDIFVGKYAFPFVLGLLNLPIYKNNKFQWQPKRLHCKIDPKQEIINEFKAQKPSFKKIAFLKELARAAYVNPLQPQSKGIKIRETAKENAEKDARKELDDPEVIDIQSCPVCGIKSLVRYWDTKPDSDTVEVSQLICCCCSFWVDSELSNVNFDGVDIQNYWQLPSQ